MDLRDKMDFWIKNRKNVMLIGKPGCGKTASVIEAFNRNSLRWLYFSAATMDPWVDFIGVPKERIDDDGQAYLDLVRPKHFANDEIEAIFMDEFNRSAKKVRNAVMELIQFKSINGKKFNNLKIIWTAINPEDDDKYDVDKLDAAQKDRFHVYYDMPYKPDREYFTTKYGKDNATVAINWWKILPEDIKEIISPRRLEYVLDMHFAGGDVRDCVDKKVNVDALLTQLTTGTYIEKLEVIFSSNDHIEAKKFLSNPNNYDNTIKHILSSQPYMAFFMPDIPEERVSALFSESSTARQFMFAKMDIFHDVVKSIIDTGKLDYNVRVAAQRNYDMFNNKNSEKEKKEFDEFLNELNLKASLDISLFNARKNSFDPNKVNMASLDLYTPTRTNTYQEILNNLGNDITKEDASLTLRICKSIIEKTQWDSFNAKMSNMANIIKFLYIKLNEYQEYFDILSRNDKQKINNVINQLV